ncbi:ARM repeat-containing protein [Hesseltinella vesiculosa]|uniref:ARM repeat-containing protein n=1 Tax=Hesseltinella vesiculosa TaxID=101127 RepID=A0A1X2GPL9_9FUNG|nr:ARM repeat-containing protein [Hesseltinella vesiculosa]
MLDWTPNQDNLYELLSLLLDAAEPQHGHNQLTINEKLDSFHHIPEYPLYLTYILTRLQQHGKIRSVAGVVLKNFILTHFNGLHLSVLDYIKHACQLAILHPDNDPLVRKAVELVVTALITQAQVHNWFEMFLLLTNQMMQGNDLQVEIALMTMCKICEDCNRDLVREINGQCPLDIILPRLIRFFDHPDRRLQVCAMAAASQFISAGVSSSTNFDHYLAAILRHLHAHPDPSIHQEICRTLVMMASAQPHKLIPYCHDIMQYMIKCLQDPEENVAMEACDFWPECVDTPAFQPHLIDSIPQIVPILVNHMMYIDDDLSLAEPLSPDPDFISPPSPPSPSLMAASSQAVSQQRQSSPPSPTHPLSTPDEPHPPSPATDRPHSAPRPNSDMSDDDNMTLDENADFEDDEFYSEWTLRKCCASALECLITAHSQQVIEVLFTLLPDRLGHPDWKMRESGILALSTVKPEGISAMIPYLPIVIPYLLQSIYDSNPQVRATSCWTLGRYSKWTVSQFYDPQARTMVYEPVLTALLRRMLDADRDVQTSACIAFTTLEEESSGRELVPYLRPILTSMKRAFSFYRDHNKNVLFDTLATLAEATQSALQEPEYMEMVMAPLIDRWNELADDDTNWFPLLSCFCSVTTALGAKFQPFAEIVFARCLYFIDSTLKISLTTDEAPNIDFQINALDLLSSLAQGMGSAISPFVVDSNLLTLLDVCVRDPMTEVVTSTFALIGDLAKVCFDPLEPFLPSFLSGLIDQMHLEYFHCNNALWCVGEIAVRWGPAIEHYLPDLLARMIPILLSPDVARASVQENTMVALGRLGSACPEVMASYLPQFIQPWLEMAITAQSYNEEEKDSAFVGLCDMIRVNPQAGRKHLDIILMAISQWPMAPPQLHQGFETILHGYKNMLPPMEWMDAYNTLPFSSQQSMTSLYRL